ncbi:MAG: DUF354 domain-containing protein [Candidatus Peribacteraceae bacterium]|nr:DUF354 domain-containing protein [Candidatus Peribacteraceae bacterium]
MKIVFGLGHPAHFHLYKNVISKLLISHNIFIIISNKDVLKLLLDSSGFKYYVIADSKLNESLSAKILKLIRSTQKLYRLVKEFNPDLYVSCLSQLVWVAKLLRKKSLFTAEDDIHYTLLQGLITYPFVSTILTPSVVNTKPFHYKRIGYSGYHKLAYLHPNQFKPQLDIKNKYIKAERYFLIRTVNQNAYHDLNAKGLEPGILIEIIKLLEKIGEVYITSEKPLPPEFDKYRLQIDPKDIHHLLFYADLFIADSQSMSVEAAMLGTPSIRYNNFAGRISVINELEKKYELTYSLDTSEKKKLLPLIKEIISTKDINFQDRRRKMLADKIDVTAFMLWFIENYPSSVKIMKKNPNYQYNFK